MRLVAFALASVALSACATVSVTPQQTKVKTATVTAQSSALRDASAAYIETSIERGWIAEGASWTEIARVLIDGRSAVDDSPAAPNYAETLAMKAANGGDAIEILLEDTYAAETGLAALTDKVETLIAASRDQKLQRADVTSYERALVHAQKSRRSFLDAAATLEAETEKPLPTVAALALESYEEEIDRARRTANRIADLYADRVSRLGL